MFVLRLSMINSNSLTNQKYTKTTKEPKIIRKQQLNVNVSLLSNLGVHSRKNLLKFLYLLLLIFYY